MIYLSILNILEIINAFSLIVLVIVTGFYAYITNRIFKEQQETNKISEFRYKLENVYSPFIYLLTTFVTSARRNDLKQFEFELLFLDFIEQIYEIDRKYAHITISNGKIMQFIKEITIITKDINVDDSNQIGLKELERDKLIEKAENLLASLYKEINAFNSDMKKNILSY